MVYRHFTASLPREQDAPRASTQIPPIVQELQTLFKSLDDTSLLIALSGPTRRGPKGHPVRVLWHCFIAKHFLEVPSTAALIRMLVNNPWIALACGISTPESIPHEATFSRFFKKLTARKFLFRVKDVSRAFVRHHYATVPGFGERVAVDSSTLKAWSNGGKPKPSDKDAAWSVKKNTHGQTEYTFGYKLHLLVDCESELPIAAHVSPGNVHDSQRASNVLSESRNTYSKFRPRFFMADKGYSGRPLERLVRLQYHAHPIINISGAHKRLLKRKEKEMKTVEWRALYNQRQAVERAFSRLKGQHSLNDIRVRRLRKVTLHCYLSLIALQAAWTIRKGVLEHPDRPV